MKKLGFALLSLLILSCNSSSKKAAVLTDFIPENSEVVIKVNDVESFKNDYKNNDFLGKLSSSNISQEIENSLNTFDQLRFKNPLLICFSREEDSLISTIITVQYDSLLPSLNSDSLNVFTKAIDSFFVASTSQQLAESLRRSENQRIPFKLADKNKSFSIFVNKSSSSQIFDFLIDNAKKMPLGQTQLEFSVLPDQLQVNGIVKGKDSLDLQLVFNGNKPQQNTMQRIAPSTAKSLMSLTYSDFDLLQANLRKIQGKSPDSLTTNSIFYTASEIGEILMTNDTIIALRSIDVTTTKDALLYHQDVVSTFRNEAIYSVAEHKFFAEAFQPFMRLDSVANYTILGNYFVFGQTESALQKVITAYKNGNTLESTYAFTESMTYLSDEASLLVVADSENLKSRLGYLFPEDFRSANISDYGISAFQLVQDDGFAHVNGVIQKAKPRASQNEITEVFSLELDEELINRPQFVINHRTGQKDIVVQDVSNNLYLISNSGKVLWRKQLNGEILGEIQQVDLYKNGRLQLAFATPKRVYVIDRNGNDVSPFPMKFNDNITQPLSVFDYDNTKNYRLLITQDDNLLMYDKNANPVSGFNYNRQGEIKTQPKHFRVSGRDYIVFGADNKLQILNRRGQTRIDVNSSINFSGNPIFFYRNAFSTTTSNGNLVQVNTNGNVSSSPRNLGEDHDIDATSKTLVTLWENNLNIKTNIYELNFGQYTQPKIFYINDKIYVATTDLQEQKAYLFDSQARLISNFPVYGTSTLDLDNADNDRNLEFVTIGESNTILLYEKN